MPTIRKPGHRQKPEKFVLFTLALWVTLTLLTSWNYSSMSNNNNTGPKEDPCGHPLSVFLQSPALLTDALVKKLLIMRKTQTAPLTGSTLAPKSRQVSWQTAYLTFFPKKAANKLAYNSFLLPWSVNKSCLSSISSVKLYFVCLAHSGQEFCPSQTENNIVDFLLGKLYQFPTAMLHVLQ